MQAIRCSTCRKLVFTYDGDVRVGTIKAAKATYPDGTKPVPGRFLVRPCGHGKIYGRQDNSLYIDGEMETPKLVYKGVELTLDTYVNIPAGCEPSSSATDGASSETESFLDRDT